MTAGRTGFVMQFFYSRNKLERNMMLEKLTNPLREEESHKTFLVLGIFLGLMLSLFMPLFNEPDGQYHLAVSGRIVNTIVDTSRYGEYEIGTGMDGQQSSYEDGTHFEKYYLNKAVFIDAANLPRNIKFTYYNYVYWGHLIPAFGLKIGSLIYPSLGVMVTIGRTLNMLVSVVLVYLIIKRLKAAKLLYLAVYLSPVVLNSFASLSYDSTGYIAVGFLLMQCINLIADREYRITKSSALLTLFSIIFTAKQNYWLLLLLYAYCFVEYQLQDDSKVKQIYRSIRSFLSRHKLLSLIGFALPAFALAYVITLRYGGIVQVAKRFFLTTVFAYSKAFGVNSWFSEPYPSFNNMPTWTTALWVILIFTLLFSLEKFNKRKEVSLLALFLFVLGIVGVYFMQLNYNGASTSYIEGVQGRYFTPTILLLALVTSFTTLTIKVKERYFLTAFAYLTVILTNGMMLFNTIINLMR